MKAVATESRSLDVGYRYYRVEEVGSNQHAVDYDAHGAALGVAYGFSTP